MSMGGPAGRMMWSSRFSPDRPQIRKPVNWTRVGFLRILQRMGGIVLGDLEAPPVPGERGFADAEPIGGRFQNRRLETGTEIADVLRLRRREPARLLAYRGLQSG